MTSRAATVRRPAVPHACAAAILLAAGLAACRSDAPRLEPGARVRLSAPAFDRKVRTGTVGQVGDCIVIMVPDHPSAPRRYEVVPLESLERLELSSRFDGLPGSDGSPRTYTAGADTAGETWSAVDLDAVRRVYGGCTPS